MFDTFPAQALSLHPHAASQIGFQRDRQRRCSSRALIPLCSQLIAPTDPPPKPEQQACPQLRMTHVLPATKPWSPPTKLLPSETHLLPWYVTLPTSPKPTASESRTQYQKRPTTEFQTVTHLFPWYVTLPTAEITTAVPVQNTSSPSIKSSMLTRVSLTVKPLLRASSITLFRVMPGRIVPVHSGVTIVLPCAGGRWQ